MFDEHIIDLTFPIDHGWIDARRPGYKMPIGTLNALTSSKSISITNYQCNSFSLNMYGSNNSLIIHGSEIDKVYYCGDEVISGSVDYQSILIPSIVNKILSNIVAAPRNS